MNDLTPMTAEELAHILGGKLVRGASGGPLSGVSIDSRRVQPGDIFVAFTGQRVDGHHHIASAVRAGARAAVVTRPPASWESAQTPPVADVDDTWLGNLAVIQVDDALTAVQRLAHWERASFRGPVIGVTGSNGKTTTKDMLACVLSTMGAPLATEANLNTELGLPLTMLRRRPEHTSMVLEMGMRGLGQIAELCRIAKPNTGIITNIGLSHLELLGTQENIARAKGELLEAIPEDGVAALATGDSWLTSIAPRCPGKILWYGLQRDADAYATDIDVTARGIRFTAHVLGHQAPVVLPTYGRHNVINALGALVLGSVHGGKLRDMADALRDLPTSTGRLRIVEGWQGTTVIDDCYNASPLSMRASLHVLKEIAGGSPTVAILGDMYELGNYEEEGHREVGRASAEIPVHSVVTVGPRARWISEGANEAGLQNTLHFDEVEDVLSALKTIVPSGGVVLVKASRGMQLERVVDALCTPE